MIEQEDLDELDRKILAAVQESFPVVARPFQALGESMGIDEAEAIRRVKRLKEIGLIRRLGPILDLGRIGRRGVLVALKTDEVRADEASRIINSYEEISHNYLRPDESGYNLWFTISAPQERIDEILAEIRSKTGLSQLILPTRRIFKIGVKFDIL